ncbi:MAG TPA: hypothetical protein VHL08_04555 [Dongiaceae bacterium]|jgi:hypothetical protein|nr:hypothetical protein [Dongiaceae bacterium]
MTILVTAGIILLAVLGFITLAFVRGQRAGAAGQQRDDLALLAEVREKQAQAAANAPKTKTELMARLDELSL